MPGDRPSRTDEQFAFRVEYVDCAGDEALARVLAQDDVLAVVRFGADRPVMDVRVASVPLRQLGPTRMLEVWRSPDEAKVGVQEEIRFARNRWALFGHVRLEETCPNELEQRIYDLYQRVFALAKDLDYPHVCRMWNFFSDINGEHAGLERYRSFCRSRHRALSSILPLFEQSLPAASAIGTRTLGIVVCFLAATTPGDQVENPRQVSAFHYPPRYGPRSPSFSRSILKTWSGGGIHLYISGTASIVGDATRHAGNFGKQLTEALDNIEALLEVANARSPTALRLTCLRFYVRDAAHEPLVREVSAKRFGNIPVLLLEADICRADLLLEVEGLAISEAQSG